MKTSLVALALVTLATNALAQDCPEGQVSSDGQCVAQPPPPPPPPPPPALHQVGESCNDNNDCASLACSGGACINPGQAANTPPPSSTPVYVAPQPRPVDMGPPAPDTTRNWHFMDVATFDFSTTGIGDIFTFDIPIVRLGNLNSSLSIGFGAGFIYSLSHDSNFVVPFPLTVMWRYGFGKSLELDLKAGGAVYYYSQNSSKDLWSGKLVTGLALRIPLGSDTDGAGLVIGCDLYVNKLIAALPTVGATF